MYGDHLGGTSEREDHPRRTLGRDDFRDHLGGTWKDDVLAEMRVL
jgi:hypothetical protein